MFTLFGVASLSGMEVAPDRRKIEPLALVSGESAVAAVQAKGMGRAPGRQPAIMGVFVHLQAGDRSFPDRIRGLGGDASRIHDRLYLGAIPADATRYISRWPQVNYIESAKIARPMLDASRPAVEADVVQAGTGLPSAYTGAGTYVGIVDTGIYASHPDFAGRLETGFSFSPSYDPFQDTEGHGTHVAGIASGDGAGSSGLYTGMAPGSRLIIGRAGINAALTDDIVEIMKDILSYAGKTPVAINLSSGVPIGPHDGTSGFESAIGHYATSGMASGGRQIIAVAAGNERTDEGHFQVVLPPFGSVTIVLTLENGGSQVDIWADGADEYTVSASLGSETASAETGTAASSSGGRITISNRRDLPPNGATHITVFFTVSSASNATVFLKRTRNGGNGKVDAYIDKADGSFSTAAQAGTITEPGNADNVVTVGSFNTKIGGGAGSIGDISTWSSLGPTRDGRIKPDLTAPGSLIYSARSFDATFLPFEIAPNDKYVIMQGTSMSAPHVAGIAALVWESNPLLTSAQMRERLRRTANPVLPSPNTTWGFGKVNALAAVSSSVASITAPKTATPGSTVSLTSGNSSGAYGNPLSYAWAFSSRPVGSGATLSSLTAASTSFVPVLPGDYRVSLNVSQASPPGTAAGTAEAVVHVNNVPLAAIAGPGTDNVGLPVDFSGAGSTDPDAQTLAYRWVLVSRPINSRAMLPTNNIPTVTFTPDVGGTYEIGLRVNDGLDDSALVTKTFATTDVAQPSSGGRGGGGGGGCRIGPGKLTNDWRSSIGTLLLLLVPLCILALRRKRGPGHSSGNLRGKAPAKR